MPVIDLNADVGEREGEAGIDADLEVVESVSSVNVACGFHAGNAETMRALCTAAMRQRKGLGAHISYLDREGFGRRELDVAPAQLRDQLVAQIEALRAQALFVGASVGYVKAHGALYNRAAVDAVSAGAIVAAIAAVDAHLKLLAPPDSAMLQAAAAHGIAGVAEGFADRGYRADGTLVPRSEPGAVLDREAALAQAARIAGEGRLRSLCVHSDTPGAAELAVALRNHLIGAGFRIQPFA